MWAANSAARKLFRPFVKNKTLRQAHGANLSSPQNKVSKNLRKYPIEYTDFVDLRLRKSSQRLDVRFLRKLLNTRYFAVTQFDNHIVVL